MENEFVLTFLQKIPNGCTMQHRLICEICDFGFTSKQALIDHQKCIHNVGSITKPECLFCGKLVQSVFAMETHLRSHTKETPFFCNVCPYECSQKQNLQKHLQIHDPARLKRFKCDLCQKRFYSDGDKKKHLKTHLLEKPHKCALCRKECQTKQHLTYHMRVHRKEKPFQCEVCKKGFLQSSHLRSHMSIHSETKSFSCKECDKCFTQKGNLKVHMRIHSGEKPFSCEICQKRFIRKGDLTAHMRVHTGEKPFSCRFCNLKFSTSSNLLQHQKRSHKPTK